MDKLYEAAIDKCTIERASIGILHIFDICLDSWRMGDNYAAIEINETPKRGIYKDW